jgi:hypothetical protein
MNAIVDKMKKNVVQTIESLDALTAKAKLLNEFAEKLEEFLTAPVQSPNQSFDQS